MKLPEPALEFCVSPETWQCTYDILVWRSNGEIQRSAGVSGRRSRMLDLRGYSLLSCTLIRVVPPRIRSLIRGWNLRRTILL